MPFNFKSIFGFPRSILTLPSLSDWTLPLRYVENSKSTLIGKGIDIGDMCKGSWRYSKASNGGEYLGARSNLYDGCDLCKGLFENCKESNGGKGISVSWCKADEINDIQEKNEGFVVAFSEGKSANHRDASIGCDWIKGWNEAWWNWKVLQTVIESVLEKVFMVFS